MNLSIETLFTTALGLQAPWTVKDIELNTAKRRIDFQVTYEAKRMACPVCGLTDQGIHDRVARSWRHLDFFQYEAWLHAEVPRVQCGGCGKTTQATVPWAREGSGFTLLFEALALSLCRELPVNQAARLMRVAAKRLWTRIAHYVPLARAQDDMSGVRQIGVDETSAKKGHDYITVVHDLDAKRLLFACAGRDHETLKSFADDLRVHGGDPEAVEHVCMDMSAAYTKGATQALPKASISYDRFHVIALANEAMDAVRRDEMRSSAAAVREAVGADDKKGVKRLFWAMRKNPENWTAKEAQRWETMAKGRGETGRASEVRWVMLALDATGDATSSADAGQELPGDAKVIYVKEV